MKTTVPTLGKPALFSLPLGKKTVQWDVPGSKNPKIPVHGENELTFLERLCNADRNSFLPNSTEPLGNFALPKKNQHFFLYHPWLQHASVQLQQLFTFQAANMIPHIVKILLAKSSKKPFKTL